MMNPFLLYHLARMRQQPYGGTTAMDLPGFTGYQPPTPMPVVEPEPFPAFDEDEAQKRARREGIGALGIALLAGAGKGDYAGSLAEGLAAMATTRQRRFEDERQRYRQESQEQLAQDTYERQNRLTDAQIRNYEDDNERARQALEAKTEQERAEIVKQQEVVAGLPPEQRARLAPLIGTDSFYRDYWEATKPEEPVKPQFFELSPGQTRYEYKDGKAVPIMSRPPAASSGDGERIPTTRQFADGTTRQWDPGSKSWEVLASAAPTEEQLHDDIAQEAERRFRAWHAERMKGVGEVEWEKLKPGMKQPPVKQSPSQKKLRVKMRDGSERIMTEEQYMRWQFRLEAEEEVRRRRKTAQGMRGGNVIIDFDENGNPLQ